MMNLTQVDVARRAGVSQKAVSFALSGDPALNTKLRPETRARIQLTAQQMGYVPHHAARRLAQSRSARPPHTLDQVGLIYFSGPGVYTDPILMLIMGGAEPELGKLDTALTFIRASKRSDWSRVERMARTGGVDGWLLYGLVTNEIVDWFQSRNLPYLVLADHRCTRPIPSVNIDNHAVGRMAVDYLASQGHRRIAILQMPHRFVYQREILNGFRARVKELGIDVDDRLEVSWVSDQPITLDWLKSARPTALFVPEFDVAAVMHAAFQKLGVAVPREISVVAFEAALMASVANQNFTRIECPMIELGRQGALALRQLVANASATPAAPIQQRLSPALVEGWSTSNPQT